VSAEGEGEASGTVQYRAASFTSTGEADGG
jgi:hypothetical protein